MTLRLTILGTGYLGATTAACLAEMGFEVLGMDVDKAKVEALTEGRLPFYEPGLPGLLRKHVDGGRLRFTTSYAEAAEFGDVHFLCVGTPQREGEHAADLSYVNSVVDGLAPHLRRPTLVVGKSTVPVGTAARLEQRLHDLAPVGDGVELAWNPEFLREGFAVEDTLRPDRIVVGLPATSTTGEALLREVFAQPIAEGTPFLVTDYATAELVKGSANAFLATKISFINAMAELCEATGADVTVLADALGHDARIGRRFLNAGIGFGGGCLPKDIRAFSARAGELGIDLTLLREVDAINLRRRAHVVDLARELVGGSLRGARVGVLGAAFKPDSDDVRDSPALAVAGALQLQGAVVTVYDPQAIENARNVFPTLGYADSALAACQAADLVVHVTEWAEFRELEPAALGDVVSERRVLDARNVLDPARWRAAGWTYRALGRP